MFPNSYKKLLKYPSYCKKYADKIISHENKSTHIAYNVDKCAVRQIKVDGDILKRNDNSQCRADYLILNMNKKTAYIIELKGVDIKHAFEQIENTDEHLQKALAGHKIYWRVVYCSRSLKMRSNKINKYLKNHKQLKIGNRLMEEDI